ncbi:MAG: hypothetical protein DCE86_05300 [Flavobacteriaceae bacterium]|nr:MAG: hypothetical protein DCE86_05300 [Flavobacteriaceae bacterium]
MQIQDISQLEKKAANTASVLLRGAMRSEIKSVFKRRSGALEKTNVSPRFKDGRLDRLVISSPKYSFTWHYGSKKTGITPSYFRKGGAVKAFTMHLQSGPKEIPAHNRSGGIVKSHNKGIDYKSTNHIAKALSSGNVLENLATQLCENRAVLITSIIDF